MARETRETDERKTGAGKEVNHKDRKERRTVKDMKEQEETENLFVSPWSPLSPVQSTLGPALLPSFPSVYGFLVDVNA